MDLEGAIAFILEQQKRAEAVRREHDELFRKNEEYRWETEQLRRQNEERWRETDERWAKTDERWRKAEARMDRYDKKFEATRQLVEAGIKMMVEMRREFRVLAAESKATRLELRALTKSLNRSFNGRNGH
jgi:hypothetical protein